MPLNSTAVPNASADVVGVFDQSFNQVFVEARPIKATVKENKKAMEHPVETGSQVTDFVVIEQVEIEFPVVVVSDDYRSVYQQIKQLYKNSTLLSVQTRTDTYNNMMIINMPHDEDAEQFDVISIGLKLREVILVQPKDGKLPASKVKSKAKSDTVDRGVQLYKTPAGPQQPKASILKQWFG